MRILYVGDVVGKPGRDAVAELVPKLRRSERLDAVVINCENAAGGAGVTPPVAIELLRAGADVLTSGNHVWKFREITPYLGAEPRLVRPANYPGDAPGRGLFVLKLPGGRTLAVLQLEGRVFMRDLDCPFRCADRELGALKALGAPVTAILVDIHAEATSEKQAMAHYLDGRVAAVVGTHTHVQTADEQVLAGGTAYITDVGMTGPHDSVIGLRAPLAIERFLTQRFVRHEVATGQVLLCGVIVDIDDATGRAVTIERVRRAVD